jgi:hypothetical protein
MRRLLLIAALLAPGLAMADAPTYDDVLNYDYVYLSRNSGSDGHGAAGGYKSFGHAHVFASVDDTAFYAGSHANWNYDLRTWRVGGGAHYLVGESTMIAPAFSAFHSAGHVQAPWWPAARGLSGDGYIAEVDLRHAMNLHVELVAAARRTQFKGDRWNEFVGGVMFHANADWAFGALYHRRDQRSSSEVTLRYYY